MAYKRTSPMPIAEGGTNTSSFSNTDGVVYFDGTHLNTTAVGTSTFVLTSNGSGMAPTFQAASGGSGVSTLTGNTGGALSPSAGNINIEGSGNVSISGSGSTLTVVANNQGQIVNVTNITTGTYAALSTDYFIGCESSTGAITVQLPDAPPVGTTYVVKDISGDAGSNNVIVTTVGGTVMIDGVTTATFPIGYRAYTFIYNGVTGWSAASYITAGF